LKPPDIVSPTILTRACRILTSFLNSGTKIIPFLVTQDSLISSFMKHLNLPVLLEFIDALIKTKDPQVLDWFFSSKVLQEAIQIMADSDWSVVQDHAMSLVTSLISVTKEMESSFVMEDFVGDLFSLAFKSKTDAIFNLLSTIVNKHSHKFNNNDDNNSIVSLVLKQLPQIKSAINQENKTRLGPYGNITLCGPGVIAMIGFINELVRANISIVNKEIMELNLIEDCFSIFFRCTMNNFLHTAVVKIVDGILNVSNDDDLKLSLFTKYDVLNQILNGLNNCNQKDEYGFCHGLYAYGGHLYRMAYYIVSKQQNEKLVAIIQANDKWKEFEQKEFPEVYKNYLSTDVWKPCPWE